MFSILGVFVVAGALVLSACGDDEKSGASTETTSASTTTAADDGDGVANDFIGLTKDKAIEKADADNNPWRIGEEDGEVFALTMDYNPDRVTFVINDGVVTAATWG